MNLTVKIYLLVNCLLCIRLAVKAQEYNSGTYTFTVATQPDTKINFTKNEIEKGLTVVTFAFKVSNSAALAKELTIKWSIPLIGIAGYWVSNSNEPRFIRMSTPISSNIASQAPVISLFGNNSVNRCTFALSDAFHQTVLNASINEAEAILNCSANIKLERDEKKTNYEVSIFLDNRSVGFYESLKQVSLWWAYMPAYRPALTPDAARMPLYSTWYSYHQNFTDGALLNECSRAKAMGYAGIIVDDGWQTLNHSGGYGYTGDWKPERLANMANFVKEIHRTGMKCLLWYSVPFIGYHALSYKKFQGKYLYQSDHLSAGILDPRYPDVRKFIVERYVEALKAWNLDGFKLDFIDSFTNQPGDPPIVNAEADFTSLYAGVDALMLEIKKALTTIKPNILIEFRQSYIGPAMRKYGNMFRAGDCPNAALTNRVRTTDIKLLAGTTAVHSDMLTWSYQEPTNIAALQFLNIIFAVPQLSVRLKELPPSQQRMLNFYTHYWLANKAILLDGDFKVYGPELNYPLLTSEKNNKLIAGVYSDQGWPIQVNYPVIDILNAKTTTGILLKTSKANVYHADIFNCEGKRISSRKISLSRGIHTFKVPPAGMIALVELQSSYHK